MTEDTRRQSPHPLIRRDRWYLWPVILAGALLTLVWMASGNHPAAPGGPAIVLDGDPGANAEFCRQFILDGLRNDQLPQPCQPMATRICADLKPGGWTYLPACRR